MDRSAVVLAYDFSTMLVQDKDVLELDDKPLIRHVVDAVSPVVEETIVVTESEDKIKNYTKILGKKVRFVVDSCLSQDPLVGALPGFNAAKGKYSLLVPADSPFISEQVVSLLFELCIGKTAAIPRHTDGQIEPLHAVYHTKLALEAARQAVDHDEMGMDAMIGKLRGVRYVSTLVIEQLDPDLKTFFSIRTPLDLRRALAMVKPKKTKSRKLKN